jgi:hypothetical protein
MDSVFSDPFEVSQRKRGDAAPPADACVDNIFSRVISILEQKDCSRQEYPSRVVQAKMTLGKKNLIEQLIVAFASTREKPAMVADGCGWLRMVAI